MPHSPSLTDDAGPQGMCQDPDDPVPCYMFSSGSCPEKDCVVIDDDCQSAIEVRLESKGDGTTWHEHDGTAVTS
jgi:hypothetical protein